MKCNYLLISYTIITFDGDVYNKKKLIRFRNILLHDCQTQYDRLVFTVEKHICKLIETLIHHSKSQLSLLPNDHATYISNTSPNNGRVKKNLVQYNRMLVHDPQQCRDPWVLLCG